MRFKKKGWPFHQAKAKCGSCGDTIISYRGGLFQRCGCGESFIDQERWTALYVRAGGKAKFIKRICPENCEIEEHIEENK